MHKLVSTAVICLRYAFNLHGPPRPPFAPNEPESMSETKMTLAHLNYMFGAIETKYF